MCGLEEVVEGWLHRSTFGCELPPTPTPRPALPPQVAAAAGAVGGGLACHRPAAAAVRPAVAARTEPHACVIEPPPGGRSQCAHISSVGIGGSARLLARRRRIRRQRAIAASNGGVSERRRAAGRIELCTASFPACLPSTPASKRAVSTCAAHRGETWARPCSGGGLAASGGGGGPCCTVGASCSCQSTMVSLSHELTATGLSGRLWMDGAATHVFAVPRAQSQSRCSPLKPPLQPGAF